MQLVKDRVYLASCQKCQERINVLLLKILKEDGKTWYVCPECAEEKVHKEVR